MVDRDYDLLIQDWLKKRNNEFWVTTIDVINKMVEKKTISKFVNIPDNWIPIPKAAAEGMIVGLVDVLSRESFLKRLLEDHFKYSLHGFGDPVFDDLYDQVFDEVEIKIFFMTELGDRFKERMAKFFNLD